MLVSGSVMALGFEIWRLWQELELRQPQLEP